MTRKPVERRTPASKPASKTDWRRFDALTDADIAAAVAADPDAAPIIKPSWIKKAKLVEPSRRAPRR